AAEGGHEQLLDLRAPGIRHRHGPDEGERHEQAEEHFRDTVHGAQHRLASGLLGWGRRAHSGRSCFACRRSMALPLLSAWTRLVGMGTAGNGTLVSISRPAEGGPAPLIIL